MVGEVWDEEGVVGRLVGTKKNQWWECAQSIINLTFSHACTKVQIYTTYLQMKAKVNFLI